MMFFRKYKKEINRLNSELTLLKFDYDRLTSKCNSVISTNNKCKKIESEYLGMCSEIIDLKESYTSMHVRFSKQIERKNKQIRDLRKWKGVDTESQYVEIYKLRKMLEQQVLINNNLTS